ncbi:hypothetical protein R1sor_022297 [Riccia sorocarpa]|uniref:Uncharacterized protein n=1 Tax=Riccia sorocarpa TaxID=122646 RepID=A0ABD3GKY9_9MARC
MDRKGKIASVARIKGSQLYLDSVPASLHETSNLRSGENNVRRPGQCSNSQQNECSAATGPYGSRSTAYQDAKAVASAVSRSFNFPTVDDLPPIYEDLGADAILDVHNASIDLQESILALLFDSNAPTPIALPNGQVDYRDMSLGSLLRHAGREWRGGELGLRGLCSLSVVVS